MTRSRIEPAIDSAVAKVPNRGLVNDSKGADLHPEHEPMTATPAASIFRWFHKTCHERLKRYASLPRNGIYSRILGADNIRLGRGNMIKGISGVRIGHSFRALDHLWLDAIQDDKFGRSLKPSLVIGDNVVFGHCVHVAATHCVRIGNDVLVGSRVMITDHNHGIYRGRAQSSPSERPADRQLTADAETIVEDRVWIGDGVVILPGARIGKGSVIGANSVVNGVIPAECIAAGSPAQPIKQYDHESKMWLRAARGGSADSCARGEATS
jgi:acetyltransferase-like isoleucine patch superfamily enzyme